MSTKFLLPILLLFSSHSFAQHFKKKDGVHFTQPLNGFDSARIYFKHLRNNYNLPLYYQSYDFEKNALSEIV